MARSPIDDLIVFILAGMTVVLLFGAPFLFLAAFSF